MTKELLYDIIEDIAADADMDVDSFVRSLEKQRNDFFYQKNASLPKDAADYVNAAREEKKALRSERRTQAKKDKLSQEIKLFRRIFPNVKSEAIPDSVWKDMESGIPLPYAYALFLTADKGNRSYADSVNEKNSEGALPPVNGDGESELTMEQVEAMSPEAVKKSFPQILRSLGKWKI